MLRPSLVTRGRHKLTRKQAANSSATARAAREIRVGRGCGSGAAGVAGGTGGSSPGAVGLVTSGRRVNPIRLPRARPWWRAAFRGRAYSILISDAVTTFFFLTPLPSSLITPLTMAGLGARADGVVVSLLTCWRQVVEGVLPPSLT